VEGKKREEGRRLDPETPIQRQRGNKEGEKSPRVANQRGVGSRRREFMKVRRQGKKKKEGEGGR